MPTGYAECILYVKKYKLSDDGNSEVKIEKFRVTKYIGKM
jgi:hypothetical protein